jgi:hypothetical protein
MLLATFILRTLELDKIIGVRNKIMRVINGVFLCRRNTPFLLFLQPWAAARRHVW